jgi:hypothetical protein
VIDLDHAVRVDVDRRQHLQSKKDKKLSFYKGLLTQSNMYEMCHMTQQKN